MTTETTPTDRHAIVEIFGHRKRAGRACDVSEFGAAMLEIDVPKRDGSIETERYGGSAIFSMRFVSAEEAQKAAEAMWPWAPPSAPQLPRGAAEGEFDEDEPALGDEPTFEPEGDERDEHEDGVPA